ncbi:MAG: hypothetical protein LBC33_02660 [Mycoplasmataceae bacterium]|jgi:hypothetical protein|nr:hypothetical protein [Mycoplasmataceae bacterium]
MAINKVTIDQVKRMNEAEWEKYRREKWESKKVDYAKPVPGYFLASKDSYAEWISKQKEKGNKRIALEPETIKAMSDEEWNKFRDERWKNKGKIYAGDAPDWFMKRDDYLKNLRKK